MLFWAFGVAIEGFKHYRPTIQISGTFLHGKYAGKLLIPTLIDGNEQFFPLAFALAKKETIDSWSWFLSIIRSNVTPPHGVCIIFYRHVGIKATFQNAEF